MHIQPRITRLIKVTTLKYLCITHGDQRVFHLPPDEVGVGGIVVASDVCSARRPSVRVSFPQQISGNPWEDLFHVMTFFYVNKISVMGSYSEPYMYESYKSDTSRLKS